MAFDPKRLSRRGAAAGLEPWTGGETLYVREFSALESVEMVERWEAIQGDTPARIRAIAEAVTGVLFDADGKAVFADVEAAMATSVAFLEAAFSAAMDFNKLSDGAREDVRKNSEAARLDASSNGSASREAAST